MKRYIGLILVWVAHTAWAQDSLSLRFYASSTGQVITRLQLRSKDSHQTYFSSTAGYVTIPFPPATGSDYIATASGYLTQTWHLTPAMAQSDTLSLPMEARSNELSTLVIRSSRIPLHASESPQHMELVQPDDIQEGTAESPANIRELLSELSGTQIQQTSGISATVDIRLEGLDGRYTELLKDGFPLYGGLSGSLDVLQIPPLDLQQVEVMLGAGSTLYGPNAIAGFINLISKQPDTTWQAQAVLSQSQKSNTAWSAYASHRGVHSGFSLLLSANRQQAVDVNSDGFSDLPFIRGGTVEPSFYWYPSSHTEARLTVNLGAEHRMGGDMLAIRYGADSLHPVLEHTQSWRSSYQLSVDHQMPSGYSVHVRNSLGYFFRNLQTPDGHLDGQQYSTYTEAYLQHAGSRHQDLLGLSLTTQAFDPADPKTATVAAFQQRSSGVFIQDDWAPSRRWHLESALRLDGSDRLYLLPRLAILRKLTPFLSLRLGSGTGYMLPSPFNATAESSGYAYQDALPRNLRTEQSWSSNLDLNFAKALDSRWFLEFDQNVFQTLLYHGLIVQPDSLNPSSIRLENAPGTIRSRGFQTQVHLNRGFWSLASSFSFTDARKTYAQKSPMVLSPKSRWSSSLTYEKEGAVKAGLEAFYTGPQYVDDQSMSHPFWTFDAMVAKTWNAWTLMLNVENFSNTLQSRFGPMYVGSIQHPHFSPVYGPTEGRVITVSLEWSLASKQDD